MFNLQTRLAASLRNLVKAPNFPWRVCLVSASLFLFSCQTNSVGIRGFDSQSSLNNDKARVILLHGMYRDASAMVVIEEHLTGLGYQVSNISYPSTKFDIETLVNDYLVPAVEKLRRDGDQTIHFVTHSMGGILVRYYLKVHALQELGKVVMIAPPNGGTQLAELFSDLPWGDTTTNPAKLQLSAEPGSWVNQLGPVYFELGVIAGNDNSNLLTDWILQGEDDGVVTVENTKVENMQDFIVLPEKHFRLRGNSSVLQQAAYFLKYASFYRAEKTVIDS